MIEVIRSAAAVDPDIDALWARIGAEYLANQHAIVERIAEKGALRPGLDVDRAADILWTINHPTLWQLLVGERGWEPEAYEQWSAGAACSELLAASPRRRSGPAAHLE